MRKSLAVLAAILVLGVVNYAIYAKERHLRAGRVMHLALAPVDPRSLMQGDYMALNYAIADTIYTALPKRADARGWRSDLDARDGAAVVSLDEHAVAQFVRLDDGRALAAGEYRLRYRVRAGQLRFATNAYFFEEGTAAAFEPARYGRFRVSDAGEPLLTHLLDADFAELGPERP